MTPEQALTQAQQLLEAGNPRGAKMLCRQLLKSAPDFHQAYFELALIAVRDNELEHAVRLLQAALRLAPAHAAYHRSLGEIYRRLGQLHAAVESGRSAVGLNPLDAEAHYNLGLALAQSGDLGEAVQEYQAALRLNPAHGFAANNLGSALEKMGDETTAEIAYRRAIALNPGNAEAQNNLGALLSSHSELDAARKHLEAAIAAQPGFVYAHHNLSGLKQYKDDDPHMAILERLETQAEAMPPEARIKFWFALGKARHDTGRYEQAMRSFQNGNNLMRETFVYDEKRVATMFDEQIQRFDSGVTAQSSGLHDANPIFIVGMPRSGTTLIEQILASHPSVQAAGEITAFNDAVAEVMDGSGSDWARTASAEDLRRLGTLYLKTLRWTHPTSQRITDKMPGNFFHLGLIHMALPRATIIHAVRDPRDTCLSNYQLLFKESMPFAYSLPELGRYYRRYERMIEHWQRVLPEGRVLTVRYEDVVTDLAGQVRRLLDHCDLPWDDACLHFHGNRRPVKTASLAQVRRPLYPSSVARWKHYEPWLSPLFEALEDSHA